MLVNDVATLLLSTLFYQTVSAEWTHFFSIVLCMMALSIYILYQMPESPSFLFDICEFDASEAAYNYIAKFNGKTNHITVEPPMEESFGNVSIVTMEDKPDFNEMLQNPSIIQTQVVPRHHLLDRCRVLLLHDRFPHEILARKHLPDRYPSRICDRHRLLQRRYHLEKIRNPKHYRHLLHHGNLRLLLDDQSPLFLRATPFDFHQNGS